MHPILFVWRGIVIHSFPVAIYVSMLVSVLLTVHFAQRAGLDPDRTATAVLILLVPGFIVARLLYVFRNLDRFRDEPLRILRRSEGGLSLYGGLIGVLLGSAPVLWGLGLPFAPFMDALVLGLLGGLVIAKGACFLNGCCFGRPTTHWCSAHLPDQRGMWQRRFPSQPLEMGWAAIVLVLMLALRSAAPPPGFVACAALALHPLGRMVLQKLRDESAAEEAAVLKTSAALVFIAMAAGTILLGQHSSIN